MVAASRQQRHPFGLVVTGEAESWLPALEGIVGSRWLTTYRVRGDDELLDVVESGLTDAAVLDDEIEWGSDVLDLLRMIRRLDQRIPVVVVTAHRDRRWLEEALRLAAFSVVVRPLELEELLRQIRQMMLRAEQMLRRGPGI